MKLSKIYANQKEFKSIDFSINNINFILSDDHSVGKSTLFSLIDFCLLSGGKGFLSRDTFSDYIFFLELEISKDNYLTIIRPTTGRSNISVKLTDSKSVLLDDTVFNKTGGVDSIKKFLQEQLNLCVDKYRNYVTYFLRDQDNQSDIFRLNKFLRQTDIHYKPCLLYTSRCV